MLDVLELEKKWSKYHFKKMLPRYITSFFIVAILGVSTFLFIDNPYEVLSQITNKKVSEKSPVVQIEKQVTTNNIEKSKVETQKVYEQNLLIPSFQFVNVLDAQAINYKNAQLLAAVSALPKPVKKKSKKPIKKKKTVKKPKKQRSVAKTKSVNRPQKKTPAANRKVSKPITTKAVNKASSQTILLGDSSNITSKQNQQDALVKLGQNNTSKDQLRGVIKRFNKTKKPALSLFISKKYYEQGNYKESYNYAKKTYILNPNIEDGVLLYARSLAKLGKIDTAVKKLKPFIKKSGSIKAKILLTELQQGNFK